MEEYQWKFFASQKRNDSLFKNMIIYAVAFCCFFPSPVKSVRKMICNCRMPVDRFGMKMPAAHLNLSIHKLVIILICVMGCNGEMKQDARNPYEGHAHK